MDLDNAYEFINNYQNDTEVAKFKVPKVCPDCGDRNIIDDQMRGRCICGNCGMELFEYFDSSIEISNWDDKNDSDRCAQQTNYFLPQSSLGTSIGGGNSKLKRLHIWSQMPYEERSLYDVLQEIETKCRRENIPKAVIDNARNLYKKFTEQKNKEGKKIIIRGDNRKSLIAACVLEGAKMQKLPRSPKEIAKIFDLKVKHITSGCRKFFEVMDYNNYECIQSSKPEDFIDRFKGKLKLGEYADLAKKIVKNIVKLDIATDHQPPSIAASTVMLIYQIYEIDYSIQNLSKIFDISDVTISKTYKKIVPYRKYILNDDVSEKLFLNINIKNHNEYIENILTVIEKNIFESKLKLDKFNFILSNTNLYILK
jgi:transcription initiation factor TFIIIB Brf1 subunit/transcription initiation factor TFIIB